MTKQTELPWIAKAKSHLGLREIPGTKHNPEILRWLKKFGQYNGEYRAWWANDEVAWCGLFVGMCLGESGRYVVPEWYRAASWKDEKYMTRLDKPAYGAIGVKSRKGGDHVFFIAGLLSETHVAALGGNQGNRVSIIPIAIKDIDAVMWPSNCRNKRCEKSEPLPVRYGMPFVTATGKLGESEA